MRSSAGIALVLCGTLTFGGVGAGVGVDELRAHVQALTARDMGGRLTGSRGAQRAAEYIAAEFEALGWLPFGELRRWPFDLPGEVPDASECALTIEVEDRHLILGADFWPLVGAPGSARGEVRVSAGPSQLRDGGWRDRIAVLDWELLEPGEDSSAGVEVDLYRRLERLRMGRAAGALVRVPDEELEFHARWADWVATRDPARSSRIPAVFVRAGALPDDERLERSTVRLASATRAGTISGANVVGWRPAGDDPRADVVVVGAHYDHLGLDPRGRRAPGADDNASGVAALLEIAEELAAVELEHSVLLVAFSGEEQGLYGSRALADELTRRGLTLSAMLNMDMIGRGEADELAVLGARERPPLALLLREVRAALDPTLRLDLARDAGLFRRSDHYAFHEHDVPSLFFFEGLPIRSNNDYHTWRDTMQALDFDKIQRTARFVAAVTARLAGARP